MPPNSQGDLPDDLVLLVNDHLATMDHVAALLVLHETPDIALLPAHIAAMCRLDGDVTGRVLHDLFVSRLVRAEGPGFRYDPAPHLTDAVDVLAEMNRTRPVSLVRAVYARPPRAARSFADAFRMRPAGE